VTQSRSDAIGLGNTLLNAAHVGALALVPTDNAVRTRFVAAATHVADVLTRAEFGDSAMHGEIAAAVAIAGDDAVMPIGALSDLFITRMDSAWTAYVRRIVDEEKELNVRTIHILAERVRPIFNRVMHRVLQLNPTNRPLWMAKLRAAGLMACYIVQRSTAALMPIPGSKPYGEDLRTRFNSVTWTGTEMAMKAPMITETMLMGKLEKGITIILNHVTKDSAEGAAVSISHATQAFVNKFAASWTRANKSAKKQQRKLTGMYVSALLGVYLLDHVHIVARDLSDRASVFDHELTFAIAATSLAFTSAN
jgi:hypothetical protein